MYVLFEENLIIQSNMVIVQIKKHEHDEQHLSLEVIDVMQIKIRKKNYKNAIIIILPTTSLLIYEQQKQ